MTVSIEAAATYRCEHASALEPAPAAALDRRREQIAQASLRAVACCWFVVVALGQMIFVIYIAGFYGRTAARGEYDLWNQIAPKYPFHVPGEWFLNLVFGLHVIFAALITAAGLLQLIPAIRRRAPRFHRWVGRTYLGAAVVMAAGGLIMVWVRGAPGDFSQHVAISLNAMIILACAGIALHHARARRIDLHRRWALRLFLAVSGVWFFRVGLMFWIVINRGPAGFDPSTFSGPFLTALAFAVYVVLPLGVLEGCLRAQRSRSAGAQYAMAGCLALLTLAMAVGIAAAAAIMWLPRL